MTAEYGPGFLPEIYSLILAVLSIVLIAGNLRKAKKEETKAESGEKVSNLRTVATMVLVLLYIMSMKTVGFLLSSAVYMILQRIGRVSSDVY